MAVSLLYKRFSSFVLVFIGVGAIVFAGLVLWVVSGPRSLNAFRPYIESALSSRNDDYKVKMGNAYLIWDGWTHPVGIRVQNVDVLDKKNAVIAHFPEVGIRMYFFELLRGKVELKSAELLNPVLAMVQDDKGNLTSLGFGNNAASPGSPISALLLFLTDETGDNPLARLQSFMIRNASLSVKDSHGVTFLASSDASIKISRRHGSAEGELYMPLQFDGKHGQIEIKFMLDGNHRSVRSDVAFQDVPSAILYAMAPSQKWMDGVRVPLSGWADMTSGFDADIDTIDFLLETGVGTLDFPHQFEHALTPRHITLRGTLSEHLTTLDVQKGAVDFPEHSLSFHGTVHKAGNDYGVDGYAEATSIAVDDIHAYWPLKLAPHTRRWVISHVSNGKVMSANVTLHFKPGELKLKNTPEAAIDSSITLKGASIRYKPSHPPITDMDGLIHFTGRTMDAQIASAKYFDATHITSAHLRFPDFYPDDVRMFIDMNLDTDAKDVQRFLSLPDLDKAAKLGLTKEASGEASGSAKLDFVAFSENPKNDVGATGKLNYSVTANLKNVSQKKFLGNRDITDAFTKLTVNNKGLKLSGKANVNDIPMTIELATDFSSKGETSYAIKTMMPVARLADFGLPALDFARGTLGINAKFLSSDDEEKADVTADLTQVSIVLPKQEINKEAGEAAMLTLSTERLPSGNTLIKPFTFKGGDYLVRGNAEYDRTANDFTRFSLAPVKLGKTDLDTLEYAQDAGVVHLSARGATFNASNYLGDSSSTKTDSAYYVDMQVSKMILGEDRELYDAVINADCPAETCKTVRINARLKNDVPFSYAIGTGKLAGSCNDAGELARVLGIFDTMWGGKMQVGGSYEDGNWTGTLEVKDYAIKKAPAVTKIFTIASLTGIFNTVTGNGIFFNRLTAPFIYHKGIVIVKEAKTHGAALGVTADGVIDINRSTLDMTGVLVPSYTLNSLIGHVPLIGDLITGGAGKGLVALSYGIHGAMADPSIRVNPLSVLTPGFLRNIFTIFDKPVPDMPAVEAQEAKKSALADATKLESGKDKKTEASSQAVSVTGSSLPSVEELQK